MFLSPNSKNQICPICRTDIDSPYLEEDIDEYDEEGVGQVEEEPDLHRLDVRGGGEADRDGEVDGGQHHHAGDVDGED